MRDGIVPVMEVNGNGNNGFSGFGDNGAWWIIIIIILFGGWGRNGFGGGFGGNGGTSVYEGYVLNNDFSQLSKQISDAYSMTERKLDGVNNGLCSGFYQEAQLVNGVNTNILTTGNAIQSQIADVGYGIKDCCCQQLRAIDGVNFNNAQNTTAITNAINTGLNTVMQNCNNNYRQLHDEIINFRIQDKDTQIAMLQSQLNKAELSASQTAQNEYLINRLRPCPIPAYPSCNPWGCNCNSGCGCNM